MKTSWKLMDLVLVAAMIACGCTSSVDPGIQSGTAEIQITDSPSDDANVKGVFVTVTDVKIDGSSVSGFRKQTIDLNALRDGKTQVLATSSMTAKSYSTVELVLDTDTDVNGTAPGAYVQTTDDTKYRLAAGGPATVTISKAWSIPINSKSTLVVDFDLRKAIRQASDPLVKYTFVSDANLNAAVRTTTKEASGTINGTYVEQFPSGADQVIVYAYKRGTFDAARETQAQTDDGIYFRSAVRSAIVHSIGLSNTYTLSFLDAGDYELQFAAYKMSASSDNFILQGMLKASATSGATINDVITVQRGGSVSVSSTIAGL
jgi:hypothetical protein